MNKIIFLAALLLAGHISRGQQVTNTYLLIETDSVRHTTATVYGAIVQRMDTVGTDRTGRPIITSGRRDYYAWWLMNATDTAGHPLKTHKGADSSAHYWVPIREGVIVQILGEPLERRRQ